MGNEGGASCIYFFRLSLSVINHGEIYGVHLTHPSGMRGWELCFCKRRLILFMAVLLGNIASF